MTSPSSTRYEIGDRTSPFGSGGMRSKVAAAEMATAAGIETVVCDGTLSDGLGACGGGEQIGTRVPGSRGARAELQAVAALREAEPGDRRGSTPGRLASLREQGSSLLPVGVVEVEGDFEAGDAIEVAGRGRARGQGHRQLLGRRAGAHQGDEVALRCAS